MAFRQRFCTQITDTVTALSSLHLNLCNQLSSNNSQLVMCVVTQVCVCGWLSGDTPLTNLSIDDTHHMVSHAASKQGLGWGVGGRGGGGGAGRGSCMLHPPDLISMNQSWLPPSWRPVSPICKLMLGYQYATHCCILWILVCGNCKVSSHSGPCSHCLHARLTLANSSSNNYSYKFISDWGSG